MFSVRRMAVLGSLTLALGWGSANIWAAHAAGASARPQACSTRTIVTVKASKKRSVKLRKSARPLPIPHPVRKLAPRPRLVSPLLRTA